MKNPLSKKRGKMKGFFQFVGLFLLFFLLFIQGCSKRTDPRETVKELISAVDQSDTTALKEYLDFEEILKKSLEGFSEKEKEELFPQLRQSFLNDLTGDGATRVGWKNSLVVVGKTEVKGDSATVEVTYISKQSGIKDYTKMGLYFKEGKWKIYNMRL